MRKPVIISLVITAICCGLPYAKEFYSFPRTGEIQGRDISLIRRPAAAGYDNNTGTRNITGSTLFSTITGLAATKQHATAHHAGGGDPLSPAGIGAAAEGHTHVPTHYAPATMTVLTGTLASGTVSSLTAIDGNIAKIDEVSGIPGYNIEVTWTGVVTFNKFQLHEQYAGGATHNVQIDLCNWQTSTWEILETINSQATLMAKSYDVITPANYIAAGQVKARLYHASSGNPSHYLLLDYVSIKDDYSTGVAEHGALTSLGDDDHLQYLTTGRHSAITGNPHQTTPPQVFGNPTGVRYPVFTGDTNWEWRRPLELCGTNPDTAVFDGAPGATGATGPAGSISVGSTTTLEPGESAYVVFTGPSTARLAHFGIPKGAQGDPGTLTQAAVFGAVDDQSNLPLILQGNSDSDVKAQLLYSTGETSIWITSSGMLFAQDKAGHVTWGWNNDTREMVFSNYSYGSARKSMTIDRFGQVKRYAANGTTLVFASTTTGRIRRWDRTTGKLQEHIAPDGTRTLYRPNGTTVRFENRTSGVTVL